MLVCSYLIFPSHIVAQLEVLILKRQGESRVVAAVEDERRSCLPYEAVASTNTDGVPEGLEVQVGALGYSRA